MNIIKTKKIKLTKDARERLKHLRETFQGVLKNKDGAWSLDLVDIADICVVIDNYIGDTEPLSQDLYNEIFGMYPDTRQY